PPFGDIHLGHPAVVDSELDCPETDAVKCSGNQFQGLAIISVRRCGIGTGHCEYPSDSLRIAANAAARLIFSIELVDNRGVAKIRLSAGQNILFVARSAAACPGASSSSEKGGTGSIGSAR